jgi:curved DNA-binding protein CbpA
LGLPKHAKEGDIKKAFIRLAKLYHPDVNKSSGAQQRFVEVNTAYHTLIDPQKRASYDFQLRQKTTSSGKFSGAGQTNQQYYQEYKQDQRKYEEQRRAQQHRQEQRDKEDLRKQQEYNRKYQTESKEERSQRESYEQRYQQFQQQFEDLMSNARRKQQGNTRRENGRAQEDFFKHHSNNVRGSAYQSAVYGNLAEYNGVKGLLEFMKWYHNQYGNLPKEFAEKFVEMRRRTRIDETRNPLSTDPFLFYPGVRTVDFGFFGRGGYGGYFNEKERLESYFRKPNGKFYPYLMQNKVRHTNEPYEFPPFISIREDIMPQRRNISMLIYSESDAFLGSLQESYLSETSGSILKWFYQDNLLGKARGFVDPQTGTEKIIIEDSNSKRIAKIEEAKEQSSALDIVRSIFRHHYIIYDGSDKIIGRVVKERILLKQQIGFYDVHGDIMAAAELNTGPSGGDVFDVDIADENRILPIVFNFVLAFHTIGVRRRNESFLAKLNKAGKNLLHWLMDSDKKNRNK